MNIRRDRTHGCGLSNLDYRTKGDFEAIERYQPDLKFADMGTMGKTQFKYEPNAETFKDHVKVISGFARSQQFNPKTESAVDFYKTRGKQFKKPVQIGKTREAQLEGETWTDKVFTGDNPSATAKQAKGARSRDELFRQDTKKKPESQRKKPNKEGVHTDVEQETQIVTFKTGQTKEDFIDLNKIRDLRRALRRRYANRTNFQKIFSQWDRQNKGQVDSQDIKAMCSKMGLTINDQESRLLLLSADQDRNESLSMNEFIDLIFTTNEALNIDQTRLGQVSTIKEGSEQGLIEDIAKDAAIGKESRTYNQWKFFIQKNLNNIANDFLEQDRDRTYKIEPKEFVKVLERRVQLPEYLKRDASKLNQIIHEYSGEDQTHINYKQFIDDLRTFDYESATHDRVTGMRQPKSSHSQSSSLHSDMIGVPTKRANNVFEDDYIVLDAQKIPPNAMESMQVRLQRVNRFMRNKFKNEKQFSKALKEAQEPDANGNISVDALKHFVLTHTKDALVDQKLAKRDIESFLSAFIYNSYGSTNAEQVAPLVFTDENYLATKMNHRVRGNPPPVDANGDIDTKDLAKEDVHNVRVKKLAQEIESKVFDGPTRQFAVFKRFDRDNDGYVSYADFEDALHELKINAEKKEIAAVLSMLDSDKKGFIDYKTFSKNFSENFSRTINVPQKEVHLPNLCPNKDKLHEYGQKGAGISETVTKVRESFRPDADAKLVAPTRFSSKPVPSDTFKNHRLNPSTPGFHDEGNRFQHARGDLNAKLDFQREDKMRKTSLAASKAQSKRFFNDVFAQRIEADNIARETLYQQKIMRKAGNQIMYDKMCHLQAL